MMMMMMMMMMKGHLKKQPAGAHQHLLPSRRFKGAEMAAYARPNVWRRWLPRLLPARPNMALTGRARCLATCQTQQVAQMRGYCMGRCWSGSQAVCHPSKRRRRVPATQPCVNPPAHRHAQRTRCTRSPRAIHMLAHSAGARPYWRSQESTQVRI